MLRCRRIFTRRTICFDCHEIGHFIAAIERIQVYGLDEEVFADSIAVKIGLKNEIVSAIQKLIKSPMTDKSAIAELKARLNLL